MNDDCELVFKMNLEDLVIEMTEVKISENEYNRRQVRLEVCLFESRFGGDDQKPAGP